MAELFGNVWNLRRSWDFFISVNCRIDLLLANDLFFLGRLLEREKLLDVCTWSLLCSSHVFSNYFWFLLGLAEMVALTSKYENRQKIILICNLNIQFLKNSKENSQP